MKLQELYSKEITRRINPVAVVSELNADLIKEEIVEYVFTPQIYDFLYTVLNGVVTEKHERTGVWVNGYYGSGKSHFLKYLYYSFSPEYKKQALQHFKDSLRSEKAEATLALTVTDKLLNEVGKKIEASDIHAIMFNIDAVSGDITNKEAITKIFLSQLNQYQGYNGSFIALAKLERQLDKAGKFAEFKKAIKKKFSEDWEKRGSDLVEMHLDDVLQIAKSLIGLDENSTRVAIERAIAGNDELSVVNLVQDINEYLKDKSEKFKLVFLVDEVSQYINNNINLLLNLQSIVEEVGSKCGNKVWIICTAQQEIKDVISATGQQNADFGKIMARFETRIPLQSQDYAYIIKKRILDKNSQGVGALSSFYEKNKNVITNQFIELHTLYKSFADKEDFIACYPFVPYQFQLIADVFDSFSSQGFVTQGVKNTERSLLGITHFVAKESMTESVGYIVPVDDFFNSQLEQNLTNLATNKLTRAYNADSKMKEKFSKRVINALFMLSYLKENYQKSLPASIDNLIYMLMDSVDQDKLILQKNTEDVLQILHDKAIIIKSDANTYRFLGDDEIIVFNDIKNTKVNEDTLLDSFYKDILESVVNADKKVTYDGNNYDAQIRIDNKEMNRTGDFGIQFAVLDVTDISQMLLQVKPNDLIVCLNQSIKDIQSDFKEYAQILSYIKNNSDTSNKERLRTLQEFRQQADSKKDDIRKRVEEKFLQTSYISNGQIIAPAAVAGTNAKTKFANALSSHLAQVYKKKTLANNYAQNEEAFRASAQRNQLSTDDSLTDAEREVNQVLDLMNNPVLNDVVNKFKLPQYGWKDTATLDVLLHLARKNKRKFLLLNEPLDLKEYAEKALNSRERLKIEVLPESVIDRSTLFQVVQTVNTIFNKNVLEANEQDANTLFKKLTEFLKQRADEAEGLQNSNAIYPFVIHFKNYYDELKKLAERRDKNILFAEITSAESNLKPVSDMFKVLRDFVDEKIADYKKFKAFTDEHASNFSSLTDADKDKGAKLVDYFANDAKPDDRFIEIKKIYQEVNKAITALLKQLRESAMELYNQIFDRLESKQKELGLDNGYMPDRGHKIDKLKDLASIPELKLELSNAADFEQNIIQKLYDAKAEEDKAKGKTSRQMTFVSMVNDNGGAPHIEIKTEEELDDFIKKFRAKVLEQLKQNKIVGIKK